LLTSDLFLDHLSTFLHCPGAVNGRMTANDEIERIWKQSWSILWSSNSICLEGLRETMKPLRQNSQFLDQDSNQDPWIPSRNANHSNATNPWMIGLERVCKCMFLCI